MEDGVNKDKEMEATITENKTIDGTDKPINVETETKIEADVAPIVEGDKPIEEETEALEAEDVDDLLMVLNSIDGATGGAGSIPEIPEAMRGVLKALIEKIKFLREVYDDPTFNDLLDDMSEQKEMGQTPSLLVAIARNIPFEDIQALADEENYEAIQNGVKERLDSQKNDADAENTLFENIDNSQKELDQFIAENNYDEARKAKLNEAAIMWSKIFGDGRITVDEWSKIDKQENYDSDMEGLRSQLPESSRKEVLPDQASMAAANDIAPKKAESYKPKNAIENAGMMNADTSSYIKKRGSKR